MLCHILYKNKKNASWNTRNRIFTNGYISIFLYIKRLLRNVVDVMSTIIIIIAIIIAIIIIIIVIVMIIVVII